jgi:hypothetical protein
LINTDILTLALQTLLFHAELDDFHGIGGIDGKILSLLGFNQCRQDIKPVAIGRTALGPHSFSGSARASS